MATPARNLRLCQPPPWPQVASCTKPYVLFDEYGVDYPQALFVIDRKGVVRKATRDVNLDDLIPKLLAEK